MARETSPIGLADMPDAERIDEAVERRMPARFDRGEEVAHRRLAIAFALGEFLCGFRVAPRQRENIGGGAHKTFLEEHLDLLVAEPFDVEGVARAEMLQPLDRLRLADQSAGAAAHDILVSLLVR